MIIRIGPSDWPTSLATVQPVLRVRRAYSPRRHNASLAKNAARRIYFARKSPRIRLLEREPCKPTISQHTRPRHYHPQKKILRDVSPFSTFYFIVLKPFKRLFKNLKDFRRIFRIAK